MTVTGTAPVASSPTGCTAFVFKRSRFLPTLNLSVEEYEHGVTGAMHYHLACDNPENVFLVALRTVPHDSTGVAHILEHTALCGSRRFPVRDPFFMMIRRSLNTFMNAFTSSDWTAYPFASRNRKDFNNLLEVYLDAVFFSNLHELDFAQEGHRLEFQDPTNPASPLEYKGVVFNEMKGAMSSTTSYLWQVLTEHLFPTTTYHYNSGGDPEHIPELTYAQLQEFYRTHYHPSNAIFMTFGSIPAAEHQAVFEARALAAFQRLDVHIAVADEQRLQAPKRIETTYALDEEDLEEKTHVVMAWLLGKSAHLEDMYKAQLLSSVLMDNSASPLQQVLETCGLGSAPSSLSGLEDSQKEMSFICGLEGCAADSTAAIEALILDTLRHVAETGVDQDKVEAALHALELHQREISGDSYPYGLQLILSALSTATHRGDPIELLDIDPVLASFKEAIQDRGFIPRLIRELLLDNPHRVTLTARPDNQQSARQQAAELARLAELKARLSPKETQHIIDQAKALAERQAQAPNADLLPKVELSDIPSDITWPDRRASRLATRHGTLPVAFYDQGTNGLSYQQVIVALPQLTDEQLGLLPYTTSCMAEVGLGTHSYLEVQARQAAISGGVSAYTSMRAAADDEQRIQAFLVVSSKGLYRKQAEVTELLRGTLLDCRFDELSRIQELLEQILGRREQSITQGGHGLAMGAACQGYSPLAKLDFESAGLEGIRRMKALVKQLQKPEALAEFASRLQALHAQLATGSKQFLLVAEAGEEQPLLKALQDTWQHTVPAPATSDFGLAATRHAVQEAWLTSTQVNFCAMAFPTVPSAHADAAALHVLAGFLRNGFLHRSIREQGGAYGGGASQDSGIAAFRFYSYRDPRLSETFDDFRRAIDWMLGTSHQYAALEEAILGVISGIDKPSSPAGTAKRAFHDELFGRSKAERAAFRQAVLNVSLEQLREVTERYLASQTPSLAVVSSRAKQAELERLGLDLQEL
jgi:presequence protease